MNPDKDQDKFAFLTVRYSESIGYFGGLLTINTLGRPSEFHCSLPLKPSRAQVILYGDTLNDFFVGELIGHAIVSKIRHPVRAIFTDLPAALGLRRINSTPIACIIEEVKAKGNTGSEYPETLIKPDCSSTAATSDFCLDEVRLNLLSDFEGDIAVIQDAWNKSKPQFNMREPFARILEALKEANPIAKAA
jgi:hypothetical protein